MRMLLATLAAVAALVASAPAATAHEGDGSFEVLGADPSGPLAVGYRVRLVYVDDGHAAADATVTAVAEGPGGVTVAPVPLDGTGEEGVYAGVVDFPAPGHWTVRFTALSPDATLERPETLAPAATAPQGAPTTAPTTSPATVPTTTAPTASPTTVSSTTASPTTRPTTTGAAPAEDTDGGANDEDGGMNAAALAGAGVAVLALAGMGVAWMRRRRPPA